MTVPEHSFSAPAQTVTCHGLLFDMELVLPLVKREVASGQVKLIPVHSGTIIDSTEAVIKNWEKVAGEIGIDPKVILATSHGRRSIDVLQIYEPKLANWEYICRLEGLIPQEFGTDAVEIPGSRALLDQLEENSVPWCIVTSGTRPLVTGWLDVMKLAHPKNLVTAESVKIGKPDPACYRLGLSKLELLQDDPTIVVFEDAPAGVRSGKAAGFKVVGLNTSHSTSELMEAGADWIVSDMRSVTLKSWDKTIGEAQLEIVNALA